MANSKINFNNNTLIDLTQDTVTANDCYSIATAIGKNGSSINGAIPYPLEEDGVIQRTISSQYINNTVTTLKDNSFYNCTNLKKINCPSVTSISQAVFKNCSNLQEAHFSQSVVLSGNENFANCTNLSNDICHYITSLAYGAFSNTGMTSMAFPKLTYMGSFSNIVLNNNLQIIDFSNVSAICQSGLRDNPKMDKLILRRTSAITNLNNITAFNGTPFTQNGTGGTIYIPKVLYDHLGDGTSLDYKSATNWSTIDGYGTITWAQIQGSQYETYYADGTPISTT